MHVDPALASLAWAQRVPWPPLPVFQTYVAYTGSLDRRNASALASPGGPPRIVRHVGPARAPDFPAPPGLDQRARELRIDERGAHPSIQLRFWTFSVR